MNRFRRTLIALFVLVPCSSWSADWRQFRGPTQQGESSEKGLPLEWSADKNILWKVKLPGAGASSPITLGQKVFVTCYSGYGMDTKEPGKQEDLRRHLLCLDRATGNVLWSKVFEPILPEHKYNGEGAYQGYAASTPITDGEKLYVFFGKSGVFCFDLDGNEIWHTFVGKNTSGWGSGASPMLYKNLLIVNASVESSSMFALDKRTGIEVWKATKIGSTWGTPVLVTTPQKTQELVLSISGRIAGFDPDTGKELWSAAGHKGYVCSSIVAHDDVVYGGGGGTSLAIKVGGRGDVTETHVLWRTNKGSNASSTVYHDGQLYWVSESGGQFHIQDAATGKAAQHRFNPDSGRIWASPVLAEGRLYFVSQFKGVYVVAAEPTYKLLAHNVLAGDESRSNASLAISDGQLFFRNDGYMYCIGKR